MKWDSSHLRAALVGVAACAVGGILAAAAVLQFGLFNVAASTAHLPEVTWFVHRVMIHSVGNRSHGIDAPVSVSPTAVAAGFCEYRAHCQMCHGAPGIARDKWANGINPPPPYLIDAPRRWAPNELYWIVGNGVKMTAMPSWNASMTKGQIWSLVAFLEASPRMPPRTYRQWAAGKTCPAPAEVIAALRADPRPASLQAAALPFQPQIDTAPPAGRQHP